MPNAIPGGTSDVSVITGNPAHYVDWGAIFAGVFIAIAISSVFLAFGSAVGLSLSSFKVGESAPVIGLVIAAGLWLLWVQISSFIGGAYVTGRMRRRISDAKAHEVEMRDGAHGLIVWAVSIVIGAALASWITIAGIGGAVSTASNSVAMDYYVDKLVRSDALPATADVSATANANTNANAQIGRVLAKNVIARKIDDTDKSYLLREISSRSGLAEADVQKRLDETLATLKAQADTTRRYGVLFAFLTAASLLISAVAAWWAATAGGKHRDEGVDHSRFSRWS
jgi:hypothetical protein